jgi:hypothetical protein
VPDQSDRQLVTDVGGAPLIRALKIRTLLALIFAALLGAGAAMVTYDLVRAGRLPHEATVQDDSDPGLIP